MKGFTQDPYTGERESLRLPAYLTVASYRIYIPFLFFPSVTSSLSSASNYRWEKAWTYSKKESEVWHTGYMK